MKGRLCWKPAKSRGTLRCMGIIIPYPKAWWHVTSFEDGVALKVPSRVAFCSWTAALGKILSTDNLRKRHVVVMDWCCMCKKCGESVDHLLLHCPIAFELWKMAFCFFGLQWVMPKRAIEISAAWKDSFSKHRNIAFWKAVPHCIMQCLWQEENSRSFERCEQNILDLKAFFPSYFVRLSVGFFFSSLFYPSRFV